MRRWPILLMIPLNLVLLVWLWLGRLVFGVGGWMLLIITPVVLVVGAALLVTTILAFTQAGRPRSLTGAQTVAQLATWVGLLGVGAFMPDFGDADDSYLSLLIQVFGYSQRMVDLSWTVTLAFAGLTVAAYAVLLGALVFARRRARPGLATA